MQSWQTKSSEIVYETPWIKVRRDEVFNHNGTPLTYSVIETQHPSVFIIALNSDGKVLLEYNYRYTIHQESWELPAGHTDGEDSLTAAKRELREETGFISDEWTDLGVVYQAVGVAKMPMHVCIARNVQIADTTPQETDEQIIKYQFFAPEEVDQLIRDGEIISAGEIAAYCMAKIKGF